MLSANFRNISNRFIIPLASIAARAGLKPEHLTFLGLLSSALTAAAFYYHNLSLVLILLLLAGLFDILDGSVARLTDRVSRIGGFMDSVLDRYADAFIILGMGLYLQSHFILMYIAIVGAILVSYTRAKAELYIPRCNVGIAERAERIIIVMIAVIAGIWDPFYADTALYYALILIAVLSHFTAFQRIVYTWNKLRPI